MPSSGAARVLVVDDEEGVRSFLAEALELAGHDVETAADGVEALARITARPPRVLITDLRMPNLDGMGLLRRVRAEHPEVAVIVLTAYGSVSEAVEAMKEGAFDFLEKPLEGPAALRRVVEHALAQRRAASDDGVADDDGPRLTYGDPAMAPVVRALQKVARTDATVLLIGESGTGKEVAARAVHRWSGRRDGPFIAINCAALADTLLESELFGHEKGAFTGAASRRRGRLELADRGTFFLDEVGELKPGLQAKLLRVIQERRFERVGGNQTISVDIRWIAATNRDLEAMIAAGQFREDLYHRLAVFPVRLPPLRERAADLLPLAETLLARISEQLGRAGLSLTDDARQLLQGAPLPGNVRELANALERAAILSDDGVLRAEHFSIGEPSTSRDRGVPTMAEVERDAIRMALDLYDGNRRKAAEHLGIGLRTLYDKLKRFGLS